MLGFGVFDIGHFLFVEPAQFLFFLHKFAPQALNFAFDEVVLLLVPGVFFRDKLRRHFLFQLDVFELNGLFAGALGGVEFGAGLEYLVIVGEY